MRYHVIIDGGWREVERVSTAVLGLHIVRDVHRNEMHWVDKVSLKPIVPRSEWENSGDMPEVFQRTFEAKETP